MARARLERLAAQGVRVLMGWIASEIESDPSKDLPRGFIWAPRTRVYRYKIESVPGYMRNRVDLGLATLLGLHSPCSLLDLPSSVLEPLCE